MPQKIATSQKHKKQNHKDYYRKTFGYLFNPTASSISI